MTVRSDLDGSTHRPSFTDARVALCGRRITEHEVWWLDDEAELTCEECANETGGTK